jgi:hypothetical protein
MSKCTTILSLVFILALFGIGFVETFQGHHFAIAAESEERTLEISVKVLPVTPISFFVQLLPILQNLHQYSLHFHDSNILGNSLWSHRIDLAGYSTTDLSPPFRFFL